MIQFLQEFNAIMVCILLGMFIILGLAGDAIRKRSGARMISEFRRRKRQSEADLAKKDAEIARLIDGHQAELAALREQLRDQKKQPKPFDAIQAVQINRQKLMNGEEYKLYKRLTDLLPRLPQAAFCWTQVPLAEILRIDQTSGMKADRDCVGREMNGKRVDFALTDRAGYVLCVVEYQGGGHYQGSANYRDQIKQAIFRRADIPVVEIFPSTGTKELAARLKSALNGQATIAIAAE